LGKTAATKSAIEIRKSTSPTIYATDAIFHLPEIPLPRREAGMLQKTSFWISLQRHLILRYLFIFENESVNLDYS